MIDIVMYLFVVLVGFYMVLTAATGLGFCRMWSEYRTCLFFILIGL